MKSKSKGKSAVRGSVVTRGLYRRRKADDSARLHGVGAYIIDMRIKNVPEFAGMNLRLCKTTGVFPNQRNASSIVADMKAMVKELIRDRDVQTLKKIQANQLTLASAYSHWKTGRIHLAAQHQDKRILKTWRAYYDTASLAERTKRARRYLIKALANHNLVSEQHVLNDLPELLRKIRQHYEASRHPSLFNAVRRELLTMLTRGLGFDHSSPFVAEVKRVPALRAKKKKDHFSFVTPRDCIAFCRDLRQRGGPGAELYLQSVLFMCLHGLRPEEFANRQFQRDSRTGHLHVRGTKNPNADRVVPMIRMFDPTSIPTNSAMNSTFMRMGVPNRCRDFRRTYSIWCEDAGILPSRLKRYLGHENSSITDIYQQITPQRSILDEDKDKLLTWFRQGIAVTPPAPKKQREHNLGTFMLEARDPMARHILAQIEKEDEQDAQFGEL